MNTLFIICYIYTALYFICWVHDKMIDYSSNKGQLVYIEVSPDMIGKSVPIYWDDNKTYYDLLASFIPKTDMHTMTNKGILDIGNGGFKRTVE